MLLTTPAHDNKILINKNWVLLSLRPGEQQQCTPNLRISNSNISNLLIVHTELVGLMGGGEFLTFL